ncbi:MAG: hydrogenase iron-sulfur subunit [Anaerolineales bacterium]|nr:hydrogenase iron-sulfur subunit [Anaerolineales bacterium]
MPGDCHYLEGNLRAKKRVEYLQSILVEIGINPKRVQMFHMSAAMAAEFAQKAEEMTELIKTIGPNPFRKQKPV